MNSSSLIRTTTTALIVVIAALSAHWAWSHYTTAPWTRDGRVRADIVRVSADVSGLVTQVAVRDNQSVKAGDLLFVVDRDRYRQAVEKAGSDLALAKASAEAAVANDAMTQAKITASRNRWQMEQERAERRARLNNLVSDEVVRDSRAMAAAAEADLHEAEAEQKLAAANVSKAEAAIRQATTQLEMAQLNYRRAEVRAAASGTITNLDVKEGDYISAGVASMALLKDNSLWVYGYFEETKIPAIHIGDSAEVTLMAGNLVLPGEVEGIASGIADSASVTGNNMLANVTPTFSWVRLAQRVPVRIRLDTSAIPAGYTLVAGMSASVKVHPAGTN